jgi:cytoskeletal protein RodZ
VKGYLREIAEVLDLDADEVVEGYLALFTRERGG